MTTTQEMAVDADRLGPKDWTRFFRDHRYDGLEGLSAHLVDHAYTPHRHETYVIGIIEHGAEHFHYRGERWTASVDQVCCLNPDELHDGWPAEEAGFLYRMIYPSASLMREIAEDVSGSAGIVPFFGPAVAPDAQLAARLSALHRSLDGEPDPLARDERLVQVLSELILRHADCRPTAEPLRSAPAAIARARDLIDGAYDESLDLAQLSAVAGLSRSYFVRAFRAEMGQTPHAYLLDRRVRSARRLMLQGMAPKSAAASCGFADQAHLTRAFKARYAVTPGAFVRAGSRADKAAEQ